MKNSTLFYWAGQILMLISAFLFIFKFLPASVNDRGFIFATTCILCMIAANIMFTLMNNDKNKDIDK